MEIAVKRQFKSATSTIGELSINGVYQQIFTLEDTDRGLKQNMLLAEIQAQKVFGKTAIPAGRYEVIINFSEHFQRDMPLLVNVPGYEGVRIHVGNSDVDTEGCLLLGLSRAQDFVGDSRKAFAKFYPLLQAAFYKKEPVFITIS
jgi:hypothetical protein